MNGQYELKNSENQEQSVGTIKQPFFYDISSGQLDKKKFTFLCSNRAIVFYVSCKDRQ